MIKFIQELDLYPEGEQVSNKIYGYAREGISQAKAENSLDAQYLFPYLNAFLK